MNKWYETAGERSEYVVSTRVRLARDLPDFPFPASMSAEQKKQVIQKVCDAAKTIEDIRFSFIDPEELPSYELFSLAERHLVSPDFARHPEGCGLLLSEDETVSIMINEEDHIRLQVLAAGLDLHGTYALADRIDTALCASLHFAFDSRLGYLTKCPTNLGTALRASLMLHLPALTACGAIRRISEAVSKLGLTIRGLYGEGSRATGAFYQLSNQITLGISEQSALDNLNGIAEQIIGQEADARLQSRDDLRDEDRLYRALGVLQNARILPSDEAMTLLSALRLGIAEKKITDISPDTVAGLFVYIQPATLMMQAKSELSPDERDRARADLVRQALA